MNSEAEGLSSGNRGFILTDALCAVLITAVTASLITAAVSLSIRSREAIGNAVSEMETEYEVFFMNERGCEPACGEEADPSS